MEWGKKKLGMRSSDLDQKFGCDSEKPCQNCEPLGNKVGPSPMKQCTYYALMTLTLNSS